MATLAQLQAQNDRLRAARRRRDYEAALAQTLETGALLDMMRRANAAVRRRLRELAARLLAALDAARDADETRRHHLLTEAAQLWLGDLAEDVRLASAPLAGLPGLDAVAARLVRGLLPPPQLSVSQWADRHRVLESGSNARGRWSTALTPYLREPMDALSQRSPARQVTLMKSSGVGGTEVMLNWIGYAMHHLGSEDMLVVMPTLELRDRSFGPRLTRMINESPALAALASGARRDRSNRADLLEFGARARLIKSGANSPDSLRSDHLPYVICDEVDAFPWDVGGEGDPMTLIGNRQRTFTRAKTLLISTPTTADASRIALEYSRSDMRQYQVPCPHCGEHQPLEFGGKAEPYGLKFRRAPRAPGETGPEQVLAAWYVCRACAAVIEESHKAEMLARGRWVPRRPEVLLHRGYHINALYAPPGLGLGWRQVAQKWLDSQGDSAEIKAFVNTYLGEVYREQGEDLERVDFISRREDYSRASLGAAARLVVAGADVQKDRIEATVAAFGAQEECWVLDHLIIPGDTEQPGPWEELSGLLRELRVAVACIDSGYRPTRVYDFCRAHPWAYATKGMPGFGRPLVEDEKRRRMRLRIKRKQGHPVEPVGVDSGKSLLYSRLKQGGAGAVHFPVASAFDDEYFAQLAAERLVTRMRGHRPEHEWVRVRARNEALDCLVLCLAAQRLSGVDLRGGPEPAAAPRRRVVSAASPRRAAGPDSLGAAWP